MATRTHRRRFDDPIVCPKCKHEQSRAHALTREGYMGKCEECGWQNQALSRRGLAPNENSKDANTKKRAHRLKRKRKKEACPLTTPS